MQVLPPGTLQKVRDLVASDGEESIRTDLALGQRDQLRGTPSLVVVARGKRQVVWPVPEYGLLKMYLESVLGK